MRDKWEYERKNTIEYRKGNVVDAFLNGEGDHIIHGVNCQGVMGSGVAKEIKRRLPEAYSAYKKVCSNPLYESIDLLGTTVEVPFGDTDRCIVNMFTQHRYGTDRRHFNYGAFASCLSSTFLFKVGTTVMPKIGAGLGGGDWDIIEEILIHGTPNKQHFIVYEL